MSEYSTFFKELDSKSAMCLWFIQHLTCTSCLCIFCLFSVLVCVCVSFLFGVLLHVGVSFVYSASYFMSVSFVYLASYFVSVCLFYSASSCLLVFSFFFLFSVLLHVLPHNPQDITWVHCSSKECTCDCCKHLRHTWCGSVSLQVRISFECGWIWLFWTIIWFHVFGIPHTIFSFQSFTSGYSMSNIYHLYFVVVVVSLILRARDFNLVYI